MSEDSFVEVFEIIGLDAPVELSGDDYDEKMDAARDLAVEYFTNHPEEINANKMKYAFFEKK